MVFYNERLNMTNLNKRAIFFKLNTGSCQVDFDQATDFNTQGQSMALAASFTSVGYGISKILLTF